jgi:hypothetical protein
VSIIEEDKDYVESVQAIVPKGNSIVSSHSFICAFYN